MRGRKILISCEHAGNYVPKDYKFMFVDAEEALASHRGWDPGSLKIGKYLARHLEAPLFYQKVSRLLVETNRSLDNKELFSEYTHNINRGIKNTLLTKYYHPYRDGIEGKIQNYITQGESVLHLSIHTFTPQLNGIERTVDVGLLYDDEREEERAFCEQWKGQLDNMLPDKLVMLNCPYNGSDDGFTTYLRTKFTGKAYLGIEVEVNQRYTGTPAMSKINETFSQSLLSRFLPT
ncbi:N-formylglutamate amidohydrolase [Fulvivirga sp. 29W222]|uniref:N-formylglutamate amidohydrolase n=1 Tax=Fulvivirga marina TaxID=2494733 RepID=A0A937FYT3_9BACT|nr:N-formylglutamate amidohydrolase [Fulvivirga marina]MBL6446976.1 N-formylglutamate amidohydrolase [Fulvivirga marina]